MKKILFVCTGNTCRSCMAEGIFREIVKDDIDMSREFAAASAGISAFDGDPASNNSIIALKDLWNIDISLHRARSLKEADVNEAYVILAMTRSHRDAVVAMYPHAASKVFTLKEFISDGIRGAQSVEYDYTLDITDPYGMPLRVYIITAQDLKNAIVKLLEKLRA